jgi:hypothetical protein
MENNADKYTRDTQPIPLRQNQESQAMGTDRVDETPDVPEASRRPSFVRAEVNQDEIPTPVPVVVPREELGIEPRPQRSSKVLWVAVILSLIISITSLILNGVLLYRLMSVRQTVADGLDAAIAALDGFGGEGFHYEYHFDETIPFSGDIPVQQDLVFPFKGDIPINTTVQVPINAGALGQFKLEVPIDTNFAMDIEVPISVDQTIHVETEVPLDMVIPIDVQPDDPLVQNLVDQVQGWLIELRDSF